MRLTVFYIRCVYGTQANPQCFARSAVLDFALVRVVLVWSSEKSRLHKMVTDYFSNRKEGPKPNHTAPGNGGSGGEGDDVWTAQRKSLSRPVRSFLGYHCSRPDYRSSCKVAFQLWGDTLRATQLHLLNKKLREQQAAAQAAAAASREKARQRTRDKRKIMRDKKMGRRHGNGNGAEMGGAR